MFEPSLAAGVVVMLLIFFLISFAYNYKKGAFHDALEIWRDGLVQTYELPRRLTQNFDELSIKQRRFSIFVIFFSYIPLWGFPIQVFEIPRVNGFLGFFWAMSIVPALAGMNSLFPVLGLKSPSSDDLANSIQSTVATSLVLGLLLYGFFDSNQMAEIFGKEVVESDYSVIDVLIGGACLVPLLAFLCFLIFRHVSMGRLLEDKPMLLTRRQTQALLTMVSDRPKFSEMSEGQQRYAKDKARRILDEKARKKREVESFNQAQTPIQKGRQESESDG